MSDITGPVRLELSQSEALMVFEFLSRFTDEETLRIEDPAESKVLWSLCCQLERTLVEPLESDYSELLAKARTQVRDEA